jgi:hypothetical protein
MVHSLLIARVKDFPDAYYLQRSLSFPYDDESIGEILTDSITTLIIPNKI